MQGGVPAGGKGAGKHGTDSGGKPIGWKALKLSLCLDSPWVGKPLYCFLSMGFVCLGAMAI